MGAYIRHITRKLFLLLGFWVSVEAAQDFHIARQKQENYLQQLETHLRKKQTQTEKTRELLPPEARKAFDDGKFTLFPLTDPNCGLSKKAEQTHQELAYQLKDHPYISICPIPNMHNRKGLARLMNPTYNKIKFKDTKIIERSKGYPGYSFHTPTGELIRGHSGFISKEKQLDHIVWNINYDLESIDTRFKIKIK